MNSTSETGTKFDTNWQLPQHWPEQAGNLVFRFIITDRKFGNGTKVGLKFSHVTQPLPPALPKTSLCVSEPMEFGCIGTPPFVMRFFTTETL